MRGLPNDLVVVDLHCREGSGPVMEIPPTTFPISVTDMQSERLPAQYSHGEPEPYLVLPVSTGSVARFYLFVYFGSDASFGDRQLAQRIVGSIRLLSVKSIGTISPAPCAPDVKTGLPRLTATPAHAPVLSRVQLRGCGFAASYWRTLNQKQPPEQYGISLIGTTEGPPGCELVATVQVGTVNVDNFGVLTGTFTVPS